LLLATKNVTELLAYNIFFQTLLTLNYLHNNNIMHRYAEHEAGTSSYKISSMISFRCASNSSISAQLSNSALQARAKEDALEPFLFYYLDQLYGS
jgi:hypothetical protein